MAFEHPPSTGPGSAEAGRVVRASWGELVRLGLLDLDERLEAVEASTGLTWRGAWDADTAYDAGDLVSHNNRVWRATVAIAVASPADEPGVTSPSDWELFLGSAAIREVLITVDGSGSEITTGVKGYRRVPVSGTITKWTLLSTDDTGSPVPQTGSIEFDIWKTTFASYPPTVADSIVASAPPKLTSDRAAEDSTLTGWDTAVTAGDVFAFSVTSVTDLIRVTLQLEIAEA